MILRKPYAFLIKYFKIIHMFMALCVCFVLFKTWDIYSFLGEYIANDQVISVLEDVSSTYVSNLLLIVVAFLIVVNSVILYLMKHKKKPIIFYIYSLICYVVLFVFLLFSSSFIYDIQFTIPDLRITKLIKDIYLGVFLVQIPALVISFVRGIGFDVKKFDFKHDLMDFDLSAEDNAEFELELGLDTEDLRAKVRKRVRFLKYYYKENKVIFLGIFVIVGLVIVVNVSNFISSIEKVYKENEVFETNALKISVLDSYKTYYDYKGNKVSNNHFYVILKLRYYNKSSSILNIKTENARLSLDANNSVSPTKLVYDKFLEYGVPYYSQNLNPGEERDFILVYEVKNEYYDNDLKLNYLYAIDYVNNQAEYKYRVVNLDESEGNNFSSDSLITKKIGEELVFEGSLLGNSKIKINNINLADSYSYNVVSCRKNECNKSTKFLQASTGGTYQYALMRLEYELTYDKELGQSYSIDEFIEKYGSIRFVVDGKEYDHKIAIKDITPYPTANYVFLEVRDKLYKAQEIYLDFTIRDKKYTYVIKEDKAEVEESTKEEVTEK